MPDFELVYLCTEVGFNTIYIPSTAVRIYNSEHNALVVENLQNLLACVLRVHTSNENSTGIDAKNVGDIARDTPINLTFKARDTA